MSQKQWVPSDISFSGTAHYSWTHIRWGCVRLPASYLWHQACIQLGIYGPSLKDLSCSSLPVFNICHNPPISCSWAHHSVRLHQPLLALRHAQSTLWNSIAHAQPSPTTNLGLLFRAVKMNFTLTMCTCLVPPLLAVVLAWSLTCVLIYGSGRMLKV